MFNISNIFSWKTTPTPGEQYKLVIERNEQYNREIESAVTDYFEKELINYFKLKNKLDATSLNESRISNPTALESTSKLKNILEEYARQLTELKGNLPTETTESEKALKEEAANTLQNSIDHVNICISELASDSFQKIKQKVLTQYEKRELSDQDPLKNSTRHSLKESSKGTLPSEEEHKFRIAEIFSKVMLKEIETQNILGDFLGEAVSDIKKDTEEFELELENLKSEKDLANKEGNITVAFDKEKKLQRLVLKCKLAFFYQIEPTRFERGSNIDENKFINWKKKDDSLPSKIAVFKPGTVTSTLNIISSVGQTVGYYTSKSQRAVVAGATSQYREVCSEKAGFMIANKLHHDILLFLDNRKKMLTEKIENFVLDEKTFTPMIVTITELPDPVTKQNIVGSIAGFVKNAIDADVAQQISNVLDKDLSNAEKTKFQMCMIFDYLLGNPDRHLGNLMIKLSVDEGTTKRPITDKADLEETIKTTSLDKFNLEEVIPIDNGNILPICGMEGIWDSKQYEWKNLKLAGNEFTPEIIDFLKFSKIDDKWVNDICDAINADPDIKRLTQSTGEFVKDASREQMKLRIKKLQAIVTGEIKTPRELANAPLTPDALVAKTWSFWG